MTRRAAVALALCALALLAVPWLIGNEVYVNMARPPATPAGMFLLRC